MMNDQISGSNLTLPTKELTARTLPLVDTKKHQVPLESGFVFIHGYRSVNRALMDEFISRSWPTKRSNAGK